LETRRDGSYYWDNIAHAFKQAVDEEEEQSQSNNVLLVEKKDFSSFLSRFGAQDVKESWSTDMLTAELYFVWNAANRLRTEYVNNNPHFLNFHFQSISSIASEFGPQSNEFKKAVKLVDDVLFSILNDNYYSYELLFLPSIHHEETKQQLKILADYYPELNVKNYPQLYLDQKNIDGGKKSKICDGLRTLIQNPTNLVFCLFSYSEARARGKRDFAQDTKAPTGAPTTLYPANVTTEEFFSPVVTLHLFLWIFIFLFLFIVYTVYLLVGIEVDAGLSTTSSYVQKNNRK